MRNTTHNTFTSAT